MLSMQLQLWKFNGSELTEMSSRRGKHEDRWEMHASDLRNDDAPIQLLLSRSAKLEFGVCVSVTH